LSTASLGGCKLFPGPAPSCQVPHANNFPCVQASFPHQLQLTLKPCTFQRYHFSIHFLGPNYLEFPFELNSRVHFYCGPVRNIWINHAEATQGRPWCEDSRDVGPLPKIILPSSTECLHIRVEANASGSRRCELRHSAQAHARRHLNSACASLGKKKESQQE